MTGNQTEQNNLPDRYRIIKCLGTGAAGAVFHATDSILQRDVAIKVLHQGFADSTVARFQREAQAASRLKHPNVISVLDFGVHNSRPYLVMEYLDGTDLKSLLEKEGRLTPERACELFIQLCGALAHANSKGVVHRDIKPSNIIVQKKDDKELLKIVDFGLARLSDKEQSLTAPGVTMGTPYYLSPEVISGKSADARSDIYSVGCVLFECLSGRPPFASETINSTLMMHVNDKPPLLKLNENDLGAQRGLEQIVSQALEKNPDDRIQTSDQLQAALTAQYNKLTKPNQSSEPESLGATTGSFDYGNILNTKSLLKVEQKTATDAGWKNLALPGLACLALAVVLIPILIASQHTPELHKEESSQPEVKKKISDSKDDSANAQDHMGTLADKFGDEVDVVLVDNNTKLKINENMSDNELVSFIHGSKVTTVIMRNRTITKKLMDEISNLKHVTGISFSNVKGLSPDVLESLHRIENLSTLYLENTDLDDSALQILANCSKVQSLGIDGNPRITGSGLKFLSKQPSLHRLYLNRTGVTKSSLKNFLAHTPQLINIKIAGLKLTDADIRSFNLSKIQTLDVGYNPISNETVKYIASTACPILHHLNADGCTELTDECLSELPEVELKTISLGSTKVEKLTGLSRNKRLREITLDGCLRIGEDAMKELGTMKLRKLSLKGTNITDDALNLLVARNRNLEGMSINLQRCPNVSQNKIRSLTELNMKVNTSDKGGEDEFRF